MNLGQPSFTALLTAYARAIHYEQVKPPVLADSLAGALLSADERLALENSSLARLSRVRPDLVDADRDRGESLLISSSRAGTGPHIVARARYAEERLETGLAHGVSQYVIVGAGLDTLALRRPDLQDKLQIFEIDHPLTQADKKARVERAGLDLPVNLHFGAVDFEREAVADVLARLPFDQSRPAIFSWLGVTMYLSMEAVMETFRSIRSVAARGSEVVFDYLDTDVFVENNRSGVMQATFDLVQSSGEPFRTGFEPSQLPMNLDSVGLVLADDLDMKDLFSLYYRDADLLDYVHVACATPPS